MDKKTNEYFHVIKDSLKHSIEIPVKEKPITETIEQPSTKKSSVNKTIKNNSTNKIVSSKKTLKKADILIITEKPQAALKIASALGNPRKLTENGVPYYELKRGNNSIIVACAVGHLFTLSQIEKSSQWPTFNIEWQPNFKVKKADWSKKYYTTLSSLCKQASAFIIATDYDIEGEVIGWNILRFICKQNEAKRMKFSSLTKEDLEKAFDNPEKTINHGQAIAGETRHFLDWMYGINLSRAIMSAIKKAGSFRVMSVGRVQGPALNLVVQKELEIQKFVPSPYWQVFLIVTNSHRVEVKYIKDITKKQELEKFKNLEGKKAIAETKKSEQHIQPLAPFDLTTLQTEAYHFFKINPARTLQIAQELYLNGLISYPRTSSQKIPDSIQPLNIIKKLSSQFQFTKFAVKNRPVEGKKSDPAHPSIYPTGERASLAEESKKIYELIVRRFISCFCDDAIVDNKTITVTVENLKFTAKGMKVKQQGWMQVYKAFMQEKELPDLNGEVTIEKVRIDEKMTQPPKRYTPASLITELTKRSLGTKATRSAIIETLYNRNYIKGQSIEATSLGISLISSLDKYSPIIIDEKLTRKFEREMETIQTAKHDLEQKEEKIISEAKKTIISISNEFKKNEENIGKELIQANYDLKQQQIQENTLTKCPVCKKGDLRILYSRKTRRSFVACSAYPDCKTTFSLPPNSLIKKTDKTCEHCSFPMLMSIRKGKRPWFFCFNPNCPSRQQTQQS